MTAVRVMGMLVGAIAVSETLTWVPSIRAKTSSTDLSRVAMSLIAVSRGLDDVSTGWMVVCSMRVSVSFGVWVLHRLGRRKDEGEEKKKPGLFSSPGLR